MSILTLDQVLAGITPLDQEAMEHAHQHQNNLLKPQGSLGRLEDLSIQIAGITRKQQNQIHKKILFLFGADNGVCAQGVAGSPQSFSRLLISCYGAGKNCGINVICRRHHVDLHVIDLGIKGPLDYSGIENCHLMDGTDDFSKGPAMPLETVTKAMQVGIDHAVFAAENGYDIIGTGEVGIGNTTTSAACIMAALQIKEGSQVVGRGAGISDEGLLHKRQVIEEALKFHDPDPQNPAQILSCVGGLDIAAMVGLYLGAAYLRIPIIVDGVISVAAALLASRFHPLAKEFMIPSHNSAEPAYQLAAKELELVPLLDLQMRLGEGSGCPLAMSLVEDALAIFNEMDTFEDLPEIPV